VADIVEGILLALRKEFDHEIINLGNNNPVALNYFIELIEKATGKQANKNMMEIQPGDIPVTCADISKAKRLLDWEPKTSIEEGIKRFVEWFTTGKLINNIHVDKLMKEQIEKRKCLKS